MRDGARIIGKTRRDGVARDGRGAQPRARGRARAASFLPAALPRRGGPRTAREDAAEPSRGARTDPAAIRTPTRSRSYGDDSRRRAPTISPRLKGGRSSPWTPAVARAAHPRTDRTRRRVDGTRRGRARRDGRASSARGRRRRRRRRASPRRDVRSTRVRRGGVDSAVAAAADETPPPRPGGRIAGTEMARRGSRRAAVGAGTRGPARETLCAFLGAKQMVRTRRRGWETRRRAFGSPPIAPNLRDAKEDETRTTRRRARRGRG